MLWMVVWKNTDMVGGEREVSSTSNLWELSFSREVTYKLLNASYLWNLWHISLYLSLSLLESSTSDLKCVAEKKQLWHELDLLERRWRSLPRIWFHWKPHFVSLIPPPPLGGHWRNSWGLVKPRTLMGAVGRREAWPRGLPTPTPTSSYIATPVAFLGPAPRLTHDQEQPRLIFQRGAEAGALSTKAVTALEAAPARPIGRFVFSLCVLTVAPLKNNWTFLCTAPRP